MIAGAQGHEYRRCAAICRLCVYCHWTPSHTGAPALPNPPPPPANALGMLVGSRPAPLAAMRGQSVGRQRSRPPPRPTGRRASVARHPPAFPLSPALPRLPPHHRSRPGVDPARGPLEWPWEPLHTNRRTTFWQYSFPSQTGHLRGVKSLSNETVNPPPKDGGSSQNAASNPQQHLVGIWRRLRARATLLPTLPLASDVTTRI